MYFAKLNCSYLCYAKVNKTQYLQNKNIQTEKRQKTGTKNEKYIRPIRRQNRDRDKGTNTTEAKHRQKQKQKRQT